MADTIFDSVTGETAGLATMYMYDINLCNIKAKASYMFSKLNYLCVANYIF